MGTGNGVLKKNLFIIIFLFVFAVLLFAGLDNNVFWTDEAETAFFAKTVLSKGLPYAWDGRNLLAVKDGLNLSDTLINRAIPWLQFYAVALSFRLFGATAFAGRLPFVLTGILTVFVVYRLAFRMTGREGIARLAVLFLGLSPAFLLYTRQCRYYAFLAFFAVLFLYFMFENEQNRLMRYLGLVVSGAGLFYSNYLVFFAYIPAVCVSVCIVRRKGLIKAEWIALFLIALLTLPWLFVMKPYEIVGHQPVFLRMKSFIVMLFRYTRDYNLEGFFAVGLLPLVLWQLFSKQAEDRRLRESILTVILIVIIFTVLLSLGTHQPIATTSWADVRYAVALFPVFALLSAVCIGSFYRKNRGLAVLLGVMLVFTDILTFKLVPYVFADTGVSVFPVRSYLFSYLKEQTADYDTNYEVLIKYLRENAQKDDLVMITPEFDALPVLFCAGDDFRLCGLLVDDSRLAQKNGLPEYVYSRDVQPDWIIQFGGYGFRRADIMDELTNKKLKYEKTVLDVYCGDLTRPELRWHSFSPVRPVSEREKIIVYKKIKN